MIRNVKYGSMCNVFVIGRSEVICLVVTMHGSHSRCMNFVSCLCDLCKCHSTVSVSVCGLELENKCV